MGRVYSIEFENIAVTAAQDFFEVRPADDRPCLIHAIYLSQSSDVGDAAEEMLRVRIIRGHTSSGSGGSAPSNGTYAEMDSNDPDAGMAVECNNTTIASGGSPRTVHSEAFNIRTGWAFIPTPECRPRVGENDSTLVVRLMAAPTDSLSMSGTIYVEEL